MHEKLTPLRRWLILFNVLIATFMATLDGGIVNIALPYISDKLHITISSSQWIVTSYLLTISVLLLMWGKLADMYGKRRIFALGFIVFSLGSLFCGLSGSLSGLIAARILQAIGASAMMALTQGIITSAFPPSERGRALGLSGTTVALGSLVGPSLGGILTHMFGWQSIFFINVPIGLLAIIVTYLIMPPMRNKEEAGLFDYKGLALYALALLPSFTAILLLQDQKIAMPAFIVLIVISLIALYWLIWWEKRIDYPLIDIQLFRIPEFSLGITAAFLSFVAINANMLFLPFYLQYALKMNSMQAGIMISAYPLTLAFVAPVSGWLSDKITYKPLTITGLMICFAGLFMMSLLGKDASHLHIIILLMMTGGGMALFQSPNTSSIMGASPKTMLGVAGSLNALFRNLGFISGATFSVMLFSFSTSMNINGISENAAAAAEATTLFLKGYHNVLLFAACSCLLGALITGFRITRKKKQIVIE